MISSCATVDEKMRRHISEGKFNEAISAGGDYITKKPESPEAKKVQGLLMEAEYKLAKSFNTIEKYDAYDQKFPAHPYKKELIDTEYTLYKGINTISGYDEFNKKFLNHPFKKEIIDIEFSLYKQSNILEGYDEFHAKFPSHPYRDDLIEAEYVIYKSLNTIEKYEEFEKKFPDHPFKQDVMERKATVYYQTVTLSDGSPEAFQDFRTRFPASPLVKEANEKEAEAVAKETEESWEEALEENTVESFDEFVKTYPDSTHVADAQEKICEIEWHKVEEINRIEGFLNFKSGHGSCKQVKLADEKAEELSWNEAESKNDAETYKYFREQFPASTHASEALSRETELKKSLAVEAPPVLPMSVDKPIIKGPPPPPITAKMVNNSTFKFIDEWDEKTNYLTAKFKNGKYEPRKKFGSKYLRAEIISKAIGDLNGDGVDDALAIIMYTDYMTGNSCILSLCVILANSSKPLLVEPFPLPSTIGWLKNISIKKGKIIFPHKVLGPGDAQCCPSVKKLMIFDVKDGKIVESK